MSNQSQIDQLQTEDETPFLNPFNDECFTLDIIGTSSWNYYPNPGMHAVALKASPNATRLRRHVAARPDDFSLEQFVNTVKDITPEWPPSKEVLQEVWLYALGLDVDKVDDAIAIACNYVEQYTRTLNGTAFRPGQPVKVYANDVASALAKAMNGPVAVRIVRQMLAVANDYDSTELLGDTIRKICRELLVDTIRKIYVPTSITDRGEASCF